MDLQVDTFDRETWDAFTSTSPYAHFMQSYAWGELQGASGWQAHRIGLVDGGRLRGAAQLLSRRIPLTPVRVFYAPRGPAVDPTDDEAVRELGAGLRSFVKANGGAFLRVDPYVEESAAVDRSLDGAGFRKLPRTWSYWNAPKYVFWLDLVREEEAVFAGMSGNCRRDVRAGYRKDVEFVLGSAEDLGEFHRLMVAMSQHKEIAVHDEDYYRRLYDVLEASCQIQLFLARYEDRTISVGMSVKYGPTAWLLYAASDSEYFKLRINRNVQWEMIRWARDLGCSRYDFRGTATGDPPRREDPGYGVYEFKKSFGPEFTRLAGYYDLVGSRALHGALRLTEEKVLPTAYRAKVWLDERRAPG